MTTGGDRSERATVWSGALVLCAACLLFGGWRVWQTQGQRVQLFVNFDLLMYWLPLLREAATQWRNGTVPLWNPYQALGTPLLATQQVAAGYPLNALYLLLPEGTAWLATGFLHHTIAGLGMYAWCRRLRLSAPAALVGGASYAFSAVLIAKYVALPDEFICMAWLPLLFAAVDAVIASPTLRGSVALAVVWALHILGGDADTIVRAGLLVAAYAAVRVTSRMADGPAAAAPAAFAIGIGGLLASALTAFQWMPTMELVSHSVRAGGTLTAAQQGGFAADLGSLFSNRVRGVPTLNIGSSLPLVLALIGWRLWPQRLQAWFFGISTVVIALLAAGPATPLFGLMRALPTGTWFRVPSRFLNLWPLCVAVLAAAGADALVSQAFGAARRRCVCVAGLSGLAVAVLTIIVARSAGWPPLWLPSVAADFVPPLVVVVSHALGQDSNRLGRGAIGPLVALILICATPALLYQPDGLSAHLTAEFYAPQAELFATLRAEAPTRTLSLLSQADGRMWAKLGTYFEVPLLNDFEPLSTVDFQQFARALTGADAGPTALRDTLDVFTGDVAPPRTQFDARLLNLAGIRFVIADLFSEPQLERWFGEGTSLALRQRYPRAVLYENASALPRAFFVGADRVRGYAGVCLDALTDRAFDPRYELLLESPAAADVWRGSPSAAAQVRIAAYAPDHIRIEVSGGGAGFAVLTDAFDPGWDATVDGVRTPVVRGDCFFRAVAVQAGTHVIELRYRPRSFMFGSAVTLVSLFTLVAVGSAAWWRGAW